MTRAQLALGLVGLLTLGCVDRVGGRYGTYADAERAEAIKRGVVPSFLPKSAVEIWEEHDLDTNEQWIRFTIPASDTAFLASGKSVSKAWALAAYRKPPSGLSEMPASFRGSAAPDTSALRFFSYPAEHARAFCLAFDQKAGMAYIWTCDPTA